MEHLANHQAPLERTRWTGSAKQEPAAEEECAAEGAAEEGAGEEGVAVRVGSLKLLPFESAWEAYPQCGSVELARTLGGEELSSLLLKPEGSATTLACIALSVAINQGGFLLTSSTHCSGQSLMDSSGALFIASPREWLLFLRKALPKAHHCKDIAAAAGRQGIICFLAPGEGEECTWVDLWRGFPPKADCCSTHGSEKWGPGGAALFELPTAGAPVGAHPRPKGHEGVCPGGTHYTQGPLRM